MVDAPFAINFDVNRRLSADQLVDDDAMDELLEDARFHALVLHGEDDPRPVEGPAQIADSLPEAVLSVIPGAGHLPWVEDPDGVRHIVRTFPRDGSTPGARS